MIYEKESIAPKTTWTTITKYETTIFLENGNTFSIRVNIICHDYDLFIKSFSFSTNCHNEVQSFILFIQLCRSPRIRRAKWMSLGMMVTRLAWMAHKLVSSNKPIKYASLASYLCATQKKPKNSTNNNVSHGITFSFRFV